MIRVHGQLFALFDLTGQFASMLLSLLIRQDVVQIVVYALDHIIRKLRFHDVNARETVQSGSGLAFSRHP